MKLNYVEELRRKIGHDEYIGVGAGAFIYTENFILVKIGA
jgi:hypothetical protein